MSFHFGLLGLHFLSFWHFGPSFPFILAFWAFILHFGLAVASLWPPPPQVAKNAVFPMSHIKNLAAPGPASFSTFWPFGPSFPFILAFWAFISFQFGLLGLHFLSFWHFGPGFIFHFLAFWAFISFHFGLLGLHFLSIWPFGPSFPFILAFWARLHFPIFGLLGLRFLSFWPFGPSSCIWQYPGESNPGVYLYVYASMHYVCTISTLYLHSKLCQQKLAAYITRPGSKEAYPPAKSKVHTQKG